MTTSVTETLKTELGTVEASARARIVGAITNLEATVKANRFLMIAVAVVAVGVGIAIGLAIGKH